MSGPQAPPLTHHATMHGQQPLYYPWGMFPGPGMGNVSLASAPPGIFAPGMMPPLAAQGSFSGAMGSPQQGPRMFNPFMYQGFHMPVDLAAQAAADPAMMAMWPFMMGPRSMAAPAPMGQPQASSSSPPELTGLATTVGQDTARRP
jgi:hypothetical protein